MISTSVTLSTKEIEKLHKIKEDLELNISSTIRMSLKMTNNIDLLSQIEKTESSEDLEREMVHYSVSENIYSDIEFLSEKYDTTKSKIIGAAILTFSEKDFFKK